ncbi:small-conductance mechanosensitive channel [Undibacterium sp. GrIS 1.8]|uniref:hypothetical protein n=1 Tax=Undibacterium sp. GrIS 1.8 TaxID=3143934 RepID=UPI003394384F
MIYSENAQDFIEDLKEENLSSKDFKSKIQDEIDELKQKLKELTAHMEASGESDAPTKSDLDKVNDLEAAIELLEDQLAL